MSAPQTTLDMLTEIRAQLSEFNTDSIGDAEVLGVMNRGQRHITSLLSKAFQDLLIDDVAMTLTASDEVIPAPANAFQARIEAVFAVRGSDKYPLERVNYRDLWRFQGASASNPIAYALKGRGFVVAPEPGDGVEIEVSFVRAPAKLVLPQGRITAVNAVTGYVTVDELGDEITTDVPSLGAFFNVVDALSGENKGSYQAGTVNATAKQVQIRTATPSRASVYSQTILNVMSDDVAIDDYLCQIHGTAVCELPDNCRDYVVLFAVNELKRRLSEGTADETTALAAAEKEIRTYWANRQASKRIVNRSRFWR